MDKFSYAIGLGIGDVYKRQGIGSRFWPYSRKNLPKQFLDFFGTGRSLIQQTFDRYKKIVPIENIFITTNVLYKELIQEQLPDVYKRQLY